MPTASDDRPLSPHLQIYRPQLTSVLSIAHRGSGVLLCLGAILFAGWAISAAAGPEVFAAVQGFLGSILGTVILMGFSMALFYHLCNGIRHLFWDAGKGLEIVHAYRSGWVVLAASGVLTALSWAWALAG